MQFRNRREAGRIIAKRLRYLRGHDPVVLGLPRGGVVVAHEVAEALDAPLEVLLVRKIGAPGNPEFAIGAVGEDDVVVRDSEALRQNGIGPAEFARMTKRAKAELARRSRLYHSWSAPGLLRGRTVVLVDDGIATGATAHAAIRVLRAREVSRIILAVPVAPIGTLHTLTPGVDQVVCPMPLRRMTSVGACYTDFDEVEDVDVLQLLRREPAWGRAVRS